MTPGDETHWLVARGLWLVYDLEGEYCLDREMLLRLREFNVRALRSVADLCYDPKFVLLPRRLRRADACGGERLKRKRLTD